MKAAKVPLTKAELLLISAALGNMAEDYAASGDDISDQHPCFDDLREKIRKALQEPTP